MFCLSTILVVCFVGVVMPQCLHNYNGTCSVTTQEHIPRNELFHPYNVAHTARPPDCCYGGFNLQVWTSLPTRTRRLTRRSSKSSWIRRPENSAAFGPARTHCGFSTRHLAASRRGLRVGGSTHNCVFSRNKTCTLSCL